MEVEIGGGVVLFWDPVFAETYDPDREKPGDGYRIFPEFCVGDREAGGHGYRAPFETHFGGYMALVDDPDGNTVLLTAGP